MGNLSKTQLWNGRVLVSLWIIQITAILSVAIAISLWPVLSASPGTGQKFYISILLPVLIPSTTCILLLYVEFRSFSRASLTPTAYLLHQVCKTAVWVVGPTLWAIKMAAGERVVTDAMEKLL